MQITKIPITVRTTTTDYIYLGDFINKEVLEVQVSWTGLDAADGTLMLGSTADLSFPYTDNNYLSYTMNVTPDSRKLRWKNWQSRYLGITVNKGSCATGTLTVIITA